MKENKFEKAKFRLLVYCVKHQWVKEKAIKNGIDLTFGLSPMCSIEEIDDYITVIKQEYEKEIFDDLKEVMSKIQDSDEKLKIANCMLKLKKILG